MASFMPSPWPQTPCRLWPLFLRETEQRYIDVTVQLNVTHVITGSSKILAVHVLRCTKNCQACFLREKKVSEHKFFTAFEAEFVKVSVFLFYFLTSTSTENMNVGTVLVSESTRASFYTVKYEHSDEGTRQTLKNVLISYPNVQRQIMYDCMRWRLSDFILH